MGDVPTDDSLRNYLSRHHSELDALHVQSRISRSSSGTGRSLGRSIPSTTDSGFTNNPVQEFDTYGTPLGEVEGTVYHVPLPEVQRHSETRKRQAEKSLAEAESMEQVSRSHQCWNSTCRRLNGLNTTNLKMGGGVDAGSWDTWGIYYCSDRFGRHSRFNAGYFALVSVFIIGQGSVMDAVGVLKENGGLAFVPAVMMVYLTLGYPVYLVETTMGQYSARKPIQMLRFLVPALSGLGPALYLRTIAKAINAVATFTYSAYIVSSLFFCRATNNKLLKTFLETERHQREFHIFYPNGSLIQFSAPVTVLRNTVYTYSWIIVTPIVLFMLVFQGLRFYGKVMTVVGRLLLIMLVMYFMAGLFRVWDSGPDFSDSILSKPLRSVLAPDWMSLLKGRTWMEATHFVIQAMELGTLVHSYLGSKSFFHYRCPRDGMGLVALSVAWHGLGVGAVLVWMGYVGLNESQLDGALEHLKGHYGLFVVYATTHMTAELTGRIQGDVLFYCAFFYSIVGLAALLALVVYLIILIDCAYPEYGHLLVKIGIMVVVCLAFGVGVPFFVLQKEGLRWVIWLDFYLGKSWAAPFVVGTFLVAVGVGHETGRFLHDFLNMIHVRRYHSRNHSYAVPKLLSGLILGVIVITTLGFVFLRPYPEEGMTDWNGMQKWIGQTFTALPCICVFVSWIYHMTVTREKSCMAHRDWYKNKHHQAVCFSDFKHFRGIPGLVDPEEGGMITRGSSENFDLEP